MNSIRETKLPLALKSRGKVRDIYEFEDKLLMVTTDRISAFDSVLGSTIPYKGIVLNSLSVYWFGQTQDIIGNHLISADFESFPESLKSHPEIKHRTMLVKKAKPVLVECIVRGYLAGSLWRAYKRGESPYGITLPEGLQESEKLAEPIFTPTTKAASGHDEPVTFEEMANLVGQERAEQLRDVSLRIYKKAAQQAEEKGIIIADTKFEFGEIDGQLILIDELLTPDSSRFWPMSDYEIGRSQKSFDKEFVREHLVTSGWDKEPPAPSLPEDIITKTTQKYIEAYERITGKKLETN